MARRARAARPGSSVDGSSGLPLPRSARRTLPPLGAQLRGGCGARRREEVGPGAAGARARPGLAAGGPGRETAAPPVHTPPSPRRPRARSPGLPRRGVLQETVDAGACECVRVNDRFAAIVQQLCRANQRRQFLTCSQGPPVF